MIADWGSLIDAADDLGQARGACDEGAHGDERSTAPEGQSFRDWGEGEGGGGGWGDDDDFDEDEDGEDGSEVGGLARQQQRWSEAEDNVILVLKKRGVSWAR